jgi:hypothetical protein
MVFLMGIGSDVQVFISATRALLQSMTVRALAVEEQEEVQCCLEELIKAFPPNKKDESSGRRAA